MGLTQPTAGEVLVFGHRLAPGAPVLSRIGALVEGPGLPAAPERAARTCGRTGGPPGGRAADARFDEALEIAGLGDSIHRKTKNYSHGMRQRLAIAQAMLGLPELLVLDEPTDGLDPPQIAEMRRVLKRYATDGRAVLVSSHLLAEVEQTCTHVVVVHKGEIVASGPVDDIVGESPSVQLEVSDVPAASTVLDRAAASARSPPDGGARAGRRHERHAARRGGGRAGPGRGRAWTGWCRGAAWRTRSWPWWATTRGEVGTDERRRGRHGGYRPSAGTLPIWAEVRRQASRRRTQLALGFMVLLPLIVLLAFEFGSDGDDDNGGGAVRQPGRPGHLRRAQLRPVQHLRLVVVPAGRGGRAVLRRHGGQRGELGQPALPAGGPGAAGPAAGGQADRRAGYSALALLTLAGTALLLGTLRYGWHPLRSTIAAEIPPGEGLLRLLGDPRLPGGDAAGRGRPGVPAVGAHGRARWARSAARCCCGSCPASWTRSRRSGAIRNFLPTHYSQAWLGLLSTPMQTDDIVKGAISAVCYATLFWGLAFWRFTRKDIALRDPQRRVRRRHRWRAGRWRGGHRRDGRDRRLGSSAWAVHLSARTT